MRKKIKRTAMIVVGILFVLLGLAGLALPFLQGILFLTIGLILLSMSSSRIRAWLESHTRRYPKIHTAVERLEGLIVKWIGTVD